jgi:hypothetical protein
MILHNEEGEKQSKKIPLTGSERDLKRINMSING